MGHDRLTDLEERIAELEQENRLFNRIDPAISLGIDLHDLGNVPSCQIYNSATDEIANATWELITYDTVRFDTGQMADVSNNRININEGGIYLVIAQIKWEAHATDGTTRGLMIETDTTAIADIEFGNMTTNTHGAALICSSIWKMDGQTAGELYFVAKAYQNSTAALDILASTGTDHNRNNLMAIKVANFGEL